MSYKFEKPSLNSCACLIKSREIAFFVVKVSLIKNRLPESQFTQ